MRPVHPMCLIATLIFAPVLAQTLVEDLQVLEPIGDVESLEPTVRNPTVFHSDWRGMSAEVSFADDPGTGGRAMLYQSGSDSWTVVFAIWSPDLNSEICESYIDDFGNIITVCNFDRFIYTYGWSAVPSDHVLLMPTGIAVISGRTSGTHCSTDSSGANPVTSCRPLDNIQFELEWTRNAAYSVVNKGTSEEDFGAFTFRTHGTYEATSAYVRGYFSHGGFFERAPGTLGNTRGNTVVRDVISTP